MAVTQSAESIGRVDPKGGALKTLFLTLFIMIAGLGISVLFAVAAFSLLSLVLPDFQLVNAVLVMILGVAACFGYFWGTNKLLDTIYPGRGDNVAYNLTKANSIRPWLFLGPAVVILGVYLVYPVFNSIWLSLLDANGDNWIGLKN